MKKEDNIAKLNWYGLLVFMLVLLTYSLIVLGKQADLKGAIPIIANPRLTINSWISEDYQKQFEKSASSNFAFYPTLVKSSNQWDYLIKNQLNANGVVFGKDNYLFEQAYIDGFNGIGIDKKQKRLNSKRSAIAYVNNQMNLRNHKLVFLLMPSKTFLLPDKISHVEQQDDSIQYIHDNFLLYAQEKNLNVIDFQQYFLNEQSKIKYPIFPKHGIHLSEYAETIVLDSLLKYIEHQQGKNIYDYHFEETVESTTPRGREQSFALSCSLKE